MTASLVGRDAEWTAVLRLLASPKRDIGAGPPGSPGMPPRLVVIEGAAGMGKSSLWHAAIDEAHRRGLRVLDARPTQVEADLAYAGLHDLLRDVTTNELATLPAPQRAALDAALYRADPAGAPAPTTGAIAVATLSLVRTLAIRDPVLVAVDDVQWLDDATLMPVRFAARRLTDGGVAMLLTVRRSEPQQGERRIVDELTEDGVALEHVALGPLSIGALHRLLGDRFGLSLPRPALVRLQELTEGNPFLCLELARAWGSEVAIRANSGEPLPGSLDTLLRERIDRLAPEAQRVAQAVAAMGRPHERTLSRVFDGHDVGPNGLHAAVHDALDAGVLVPEGDRLRCAHPLYATALLGQMRESQRRALQARIAAATDDPIEAAPHRAAAADGPDESVAIELDAAADAAARRGATMEAASLRERALDLTPAGDAAALARRRVALADASFTCGDTARARVLVASVRRDDTTVELQTRLEAGLLLATIHWFDDDTPAGVAIAEQVLASAGDDREWQARVHARLSWMLDEDLPRQVAHGAAALALLDPDKDPVTYAFALLNHAMARLQAGEGADEEAVALGERLQDDPTSWEYSTIPAVWAKVMDRFDHARALLDRYVDQGHERGDENSVAQLLSTRAELEAWTGNMQVARELAEASVAAAEQTGQGVYRTMSLGRRAWVSACLGDLDAAEADARASLAVATPPVTPPVPLAVLGFVALTRGEPRVAVEHLSIAAAMLDGIGMREPATYRFHGDLVEALVGVRDLDAAEAQVERLERRAGIAPRPWIAAVAARSRGLLLAARADVPGALAAFERALEAHASLQMPLELARTQLAYGVSLRRAGSRRRAAEQISAAVKGFDSVGCGPWAERARDELSRVGLQARDDGRLSPSEERVARMAADGLTNRVIAERLVVSPKTVEATIARIYAKLGIGSRAELGARMAPRGAPDGATDSSGM